MKIYTNEPKLKSRATIAKFTRPLAFAVLLGGLAVLYLRPEMIVVAWTMAGLGYFISIISAQMGSRFLDLPGRINPFTGVPASLKGLGDGYTLYQLYFPTYHLLTGPSGVHVINARDQIGTIEWNESRSRFDLIGERAFNRLFGIDRFGRPDKELTADVNTVSRLLEKEFGEAAPMVKGLIVLTNTQTKVGDVANAPYPVLKAKRLTQYLRKQGQGEKLKAAQLKHLNELLSVAV